MVDIYNIIIDCKINNKIVKKYKIFSFKIEIIIQYKLNYRS